jgi:hypothetical protein
MCAVCDKNAKKKEQVFFHEGFFIYLIFIDIFLKKLFLLKIFL